MKKRFKYILFIILLLSGIGLFSLNADLLTYASLLPEIGVINEDNRGSLGSGDTIPPRYPISKTVPEEYNDIVKQSPADLHDPVNVKRTIEYDIQSGVYIIKTKVGEMELGTPLTLTPKEYQDYSLQQSIRSYFRQKNEEEFIKETNKALNVMDMQFDLGAAEQVFGPGGVRVRTQGSAEVTLGLKKNTTANPTLPENARSRTFFNFKENVQLNVQANVGSKVNFGMNYNTESSFDFDSKKLKLAYTGEEDEIIKNIEAGNVSMTTNNSLIRGGAALFGMKTDLQFGKLRVNTLFAQQESESKTVSSKGGVQTHPFEITIDQYDENRHFFLGHYYRDQYDQTLAKLPAVQTSVTLNRVEVWVTNQRGNYDQARNIVAFTDLGEHYRIANNNFTPSGNSGNLPQNNANTLYNIINGDEYKDARSVNKEDQALKGLMKGGDDYESVASARRLDETEYTVNKQLGYISLKTQLQPSEVLAVAYEYQYGGSTYQVGEFSTDNTSASSEQNSSQQNLFVKLLKGVTNSPSMMYWDLMMKNIYALGAYSIQKEKFKLDILYQSDTTGIYLTYLSEGAIRDTTLLRVMNLDNLDSNNEPRPDGFFDFLPGLTLLTENGRVVFPVVEPFGSHLRKKINNDAIADKYVFQELYDSTLTEAKQIAEKNKFILRGEYKASSGAEIQLGASNVAKGSVIVKAGGIILTENVDYTVDYTSGVVTIINESVITSGTKVDVTLENQSMYSMQRKTMMGVDLSYQFNKDFSIGATAMHLSEMPLVAKAAFGEESVKNTLWGFNMSYRGESQWLTNLADKLPLLTLTKPSQISFNAEFAQLIAGHYENKKVGGYSYLDDFESTQSKFNLSNPYAWNLASTPYEDSNPLFPEANLINNIDYGKNRSLLAWYTIDGIFTRIGSAPAHLRNDKTQLSSHAVRAVYSRELFPNKDVGDYGDSQIQVFNLAFYPKERGPYNLDADNVNSDGTLFSPEKRWGGIMRKIDQTDFESANIEYIEFWLLDPFKIKPASKGGDLYFNLGEISEDILKDNLKFFENGLPLDRTDSTKVDRTVWGKVPNQQNTVYAFDNTPGAREIQDVGLNGLSVEDEKEFPTYKTYLEKLTGKLSAETISQMQQDIYSPMNAPAGDKFRHFRGRALDDAEVSILDRYKYYNGTEGNSQSSGNSGEKYSTAARTVPDIEDINQDNSLNKIEKYFQYKVSLHQEDLVVGTNYIVDKRITMPTLADGTTNDSVVWYQFKIPIKQYDKTVGSINDFKTIRFMRMFMTGFQDTTILRFATLDLVRGEWRSYLQDLSNPNIPPVINATLDVSTVNIEENSDRQPVNYVLPPGVTRMQDPGQQQLRRENEQSLSLKVTNLASQDARAIYKNANYDLRQYRRMQLFTHAEAFINDVTQLANNEVSVFIRLGSDYKNNYYEYEIPLVLTSHGINSREGVWPKENMLDFELETLTNLKLKRNKVKREGQSNVSFQHIYAENDPKNPKNKISIIGNPSLSDVKVLMIGVRNNSKDIKSTEVWINELRLTDFNEDGGWAANANLNIALSDLGTVNLGTRIETAGFGGLDQSVNERRIDNYTQYSVATTMELGKFFPEKAKVSMPIYYGYSKEIINPNYNPLDQDILLNDALDIAETKAEKDSIRNFASEKSSIKSISLSGVRVNIQSENPMPYDPANFSFGYSYSENQKRKPDIEYENTQDYRANLAYSYSPYVKPFSPFKNIKQANGSTKYVKQFSLNYLPSNISFQTAMMRNYYEIQLRNLEETPGARKIPVSFSDNIYWDRAFRLSWNFTKNLNAAFESGTSSRIEEPYYQVSKRHNPDQYQEWKDSVMRSIANLGTPMKYDQKLNVNYTLPTQVIPVLDWTTASLRYSSSYNWDRGAQMTNKEDELGNIIKNQRQVELQGSFNMQTLYNKSKFLKSVNQKFSGTQTNVKQVEKQKPKLELEVQLNTDSGTIVQHGLLTKKLYVRARGADGKLYSIKFKPINYAQILIQNKDTANLKLTIIPGPPPTEDFLYKAAEYSSRLVMMIRRFNIQYTLTDGMMLPGFQPEIGNFFGQGQTDGGLSPGLGFAFGSVSRRYIDDASDKAWLINRDNNISPAIINQAKTLVLNMNIEPFSGLKIDLTADRVETRDTKIQFMYPGMPETHGGNFSMSTIALSTAFASKGNLANNYVSKAFDTFRNNRQIIASRLENQYRQTVYPSTGFIGEDLGNLVGKPYDPANGKVNINSTDVLIPAFIAAYTGKDANNISLSPFPAITSILPNWRITYDGLVKIPAIKKHFKSIVLNHQYRGAYNVGSFTSYLNWVDAGKDDLGFIRDVLTNNPTPSSPYSISAVSITEGFSPLVGVDGTLLNNMTLRAEYRTTRNLNLNISSYQLIESTSNEVVVGVGYKYTEFNKLLKRKKTRDFSNDLSVRVDFSHRKMQSLIRKIEQNLTQATSGNIARTIQFSADYGLSRALTLRAFYDVQINKPLVSNASYPTTNSSYGLSMRFSLAQ